MNHFTCLSIPACLLSPSTGMPPKTLSHFREDLVHDTSCCDTVLDAYFVLLDTHVLLIHMHITLRQVVIFMTVVCSAFPSSEMIFITSADIMQLVINKITD